MIKNRYKTFEIISEEEIEKYKNMERNEISVSLITLKQSLKLLESLGIQESENIKMILCYTLSDRGFVITSNDKKFGIKMENKKE